jgi:hypothetical protein
MTLTIEQTQSILAFQLLLNRTLVEATIKWSDWNSGTQLGRIKEVEMGDTRFVVVGKHLVEMRHGYPVEVSELPPS